MQTSRRLVPVLVAAAIAFSPLAARAGLENFYLIGFKKLSIKDNADPNKRKLRLTSKDPQLVFTGGGDRPTDTGILLTLSSTDTCVNSGFIFLPRTHWTETGDGKFKYKDKDGTNGPVKSAIAKNGVFKVVANGSQLNLALIGTGPQGGFNVGLETQESAWGGLVSPLNANVKKDDPVKGVFLATNASPMSGAASSCMAAFVN